MPTDTDIIKKIVDLLPLLNTAIKNVRLYPPSSATVSGAVNRLYLALTNLLSEEDHIFFTESEKSLLICGRSLAQKDQEGLPAVSLLNILLGFGLRSLSFRRGLEKDELGFFISLLARTPESVDGEGGFARLLSEHHIIHAAVDEKVYMAVDKGQQLFSTMDTAADPAARLFMLSRPEIEPGSPKLNEWVRQPEALAVAFNAGLSKIMAQKESLSGDQFLSTVENLLELLHEVTGDLDDENREVLSRYVGDALIDADAETARELPGRNIERLLGGRLLRYLTEEFIRLRQDEARPIEDEAEDESLSRLLQVAEKFGLGLRDSRTLLDDELMAHLPKIIEQLIARKQQEAMEKLLERLAANLASDNADIRLRAAGRLADIIERLPAGLQQAVVEKLSANLLDWIKKERNFSAEYRRICVIVKNVIQNLIAQKQFAAALRYLDSFNTVAAGDDETTEDARSLAAGLTAELAGPANIDLLLAEINDPESPRRADAGRLFTALGSDAVADLLEQLRHATDSDDRVRIMHLIASLKERALPMITGQLNQKAPWFYLRNLAYLLGQIGNEETARSLAPLLEHDNDRLRQEALKSIYKTGGNERGAILLAALCRVGDEFKLSLVEALGQAKVEEATPVLIDLLKDRPLITTAARTALEEKICTALGMIGSPKALGPLTDVARSKSFFSLRVYPDRVRTAAARSLATIRSKIRQAEAS
jgi:hypothetical protein